MIQKGNVVRMWLSHIEVKIDVRGPWNVVQVCNPVMIDLKCELQVAGPGMDKPEEVLRVRGPSSVFRDVKEGLAKVT